MLAAWTEILPLFVVRWLARRCEYMTLGRTTVQVARPDVLIVVDRWESEWKR